MSKDRHPIEARSSYNFLMKVNPNILKGVSLVKWSTFLKMMDEREVPIGTMATEATRAEVAMDLELNVEQISRMNCARKCLALHDRKSKEFNECYKRCRRTGDP